MLVEKFAGDVPYTIEDLWYNYPVLDEKLPMLLHQ
jgi:hypothetical protein